MSGDSLGRCHQRSIVDMLSHMRALSILPILLCAAFPAWAQVTVDLHALDVLQGAKPPAQEPVVRRHPAKPAARPHAAAAPAKPPARQTASTPAPTPRPQAPSQGADTATAPPAPPAATLPVAPPPVIALAPVAPPPPPVEAAPPPPPPISDTAASSASSTGAGLRVTFGTGQSELSPASAEAISSLVRSAPPGDGTSFNVVAYAAGTPEDPSTARRLSLARALAVRSALIADGVGSARIYVRALGTATGDEPPDRVDLAVLGGNAPAAMPASVPGQAGGAKSQAQ
jgi:outer membrane protein OmpA-like peptidoglycan-associated protein